MIPEDTKFYAWESSKRYTGWFSKLSSYGWDYFWQNNSIHRKAKQNITWLYCATYYRCTHNLVGNNYCTQCCQRAFTLFFKPHNFRSFSHTQDYFIWHEIVYVYSALCVIVFFFIYFWTCSFINVCVLVLYCLCIGLCGVEAGWIIMPANYVSPHPSCLQVAILCQYKYSRLWSKIKRHLILFNILCNVNKQ